MNNELNELGCYWEADLKICDEKKQEIGRMEIGGYP